MSNTAFVYSKLNTESDTGKRHTRWFEKYLESLCSGNYGECYLSEILEKYGYDMETFGEDTRSNIVSYDREEDTGNISMDEQTAWGDKPEAWNKLLSEKMRDVYRLATTVETGCCVFYTTNPDDEGKYSIDYDLPEELVKRDGRFETSACYDVADADEVLDILNTFIEEPVDDVEEAIRIVEKQLEDLDDDNYYCHVNRIEYEPEDSIPEAHEFEKYKTAEGHDCLILGDKEDYTFLIDLHLGKFIVAYRLNSDGTWEKGHCFERDFERAVNFFLSVDREEVLV